MIARAASAAVRAASGSHITYDCQRPGDTMITDASSRSGSTSSVAYNTNII